MSDSIVVCVRALELEVESKEYLAAARTLGDRAIALGARLISWSATLYAFEFEPDTVQEAVELALSAVGGGAPGPSAVGISQGPLEGVDDAASRLPLRWGHSLVRATALARAARAGEVLLDPALTAVERGELVTTGSRVSLYGKLRIRGLLLDSVNPWRAAVAAATVGFARPAFIPREELGEIVAALDGLAVVRAAPGFGGSRLLEEAAQALEPGRCLHVAPEGLGEPLAALRMAMLRGVNSNQAPSGLVSGVEQSLEGLLAGEGLDPDSGADLVAAWLSPDSPNTPPGVVMIDDAGFVDADTLEVIGQAHAKASESFRIVARLRATDAIPAAFASVPVALEVALESLSTAQAEELAGLAAGGVMEQRTRSQWAVRGGRAPLAVVEAVRESIETGEISWDKSSATARARTSAATGPRPPAFWIRKRLARCDESSLSALEGLAILGGHTTRAEVAANLTSGTSEENTRTLSSLEASGWLKIDKPDLYTLPSATHRDTILRSMSETDLAARHRASARALTEADRPLGAASAAIHYLLAGDADRAREVARLAAAATRAIGLEATAASFDALSETGDIEALNARNLLGVEVWTGRIAAAERDAPPATVSDSMRGARRRPSPSRPPRRSEPPPAEPTRPSEPTRAAERLKAIADVARGDTGDAIRKLRDAAEEARRTGSRDRCRSLLALGVALAAVNRKEEALLEALDALARAREAKDDRGERACLLFLSQLATNAGHPDVGSQWASIMSG